MNRGYKVTVKAEKGKGLSTVIQWDSGERVEIPTEKDGSVRWFDDTRLLKKQLTAVS